MYYNSKSCEEVSQSKFTNDNTHEDNFFIRKARLDDCPAIKLLWYKVLKDAFAKEQQDDCHNPEDELTFKMGQLDSAFNDKMVQYYLAFNNTKLIGTIAYGSPPNKGILKRTNNALIDTVEIGSLYIEPSLQGKGYGKKLLIFVFKTLLKQNVRTVCFDSVIESSKQLWQRMFGEPKYKIASIKHDFVHMIWVIDVKTMLKNLNINIS